VEPYKWYFSVDLNIIRFRRLGLCYCTVETWERWKMFTNVFLSGNIRGRNYLEKYCSGCKLQNNKIRKSASWVFHRTGLELQASCSKYESTSSKYKNRTSKGIIIKADRRKSRCRRNPDTRAHMITSLSFVTTGTELYIHPRVRWPKRFASLMCPSGFLCSGRSVVWPTRIGCIVSYLISSVRLVLITEQLQIYLEFTA
jgi:hypothetical protein